MGANIGLFGLRCLVECKLNNVQLDYIAIEPILQLSILLTKNFLNNKNENDSLFVYKAVLANENIEKHPFYMFESMLGESTIHLNEALNQQQKMKNERVRY